MKEVRGINNLISLLSAFLVAAFLCLGLIAQSAHALPEVYPSQSQRMSFEFDDRPSWQEPVLYSLRIMSVGIAGLVGFNLHDEDPSYENFKAAFSSPAPRRDDDGALFNFVLHPLWGSETYLRARSSGMGVANSFSFSMSASVVWEYFIESWTEHPSSQDLVFTTGIGWLIGETRYQLLKQMDDEQRVWADPLYSLLGHVDVSANVSPDGEYTPLIGIGWDF